MITDFEWPIPPHFYLVAGTAGAEPAVLALADGRRETGTLVRFDPENALVEFASQKSLLATQTGFSDFKSLRLTRPIALERFELDPARQLDSLDVSLRQRCIVNFKDGDSLMSETIGYVEHKFGLFLFLCSYGDDVLRWFIPASAMASYQIGEQLGQLLVDEKLVTQAAVDLGLKKQDALRTQKLGDYLQKQQIVTQAQVEKALQQQRELPHMRLGEALLQENLITVAQLDEALALQSSDRKTHLGEILVEMDVIKRETIRRVLAQKLGIPLVSLRKFDFDLNLIKSVTADLVRKHQIMPLYRTETRMVVALENPLASEGLQALRSVPHTLFSATARGPARDLRRAPWRDAGDWSHPSDYSACQAQARSARGDGVWLLRYSSVRHPAHGGCAAVLTPQAFAHKNGGVQAQQTTAATATWVRSAGGSENEALEFDYRTPAAQDD